MRTCGLSAVRRGDVLSAWSGIRPLVLNPNARDTQSIARNHIIEVSPSNLVTIAGLSFILFSVHVTNITVRCGDVLDCS